MFHALRSPQGEVVVVAVVCLLLVKVGVELKGRNVVLKKTSNFATTLAVVHMANEMFRISKAPFAPLRFN